MDVAPNTSSRSDAVDLFTSTRACTEALAAPLRPEDMMLQSTKDASPVSTYRTFLYPHQGWQMLGLCLASDPA